MNAVHRDILKHSSIYGLGQLLRRLASFLLLPFYTRHLVPEEYGCIAILDLTAALLGVVIGSGMTAAVTRYHFDARDDVQRSRVWWTGLAILATVATLVVVLVWMVREPLARLTLGPEQVRGGYYYKLVLVTLWFDVIGQVLDAYLRVRKWSATYVGSSFVCLLLNVALNVYLLGPLGLGVAGLLTGNLIATALGRLFLLALFLYRESWHGVDSSLGAHLLRFSSPLIVTALLSLVMHQADRYLLHLFVGLDQVGIYSLAYSIGQAVNTLYFLPFTSIWSVVMYEIAEQKQAKRIYGQVFQYFVYCQMLIFLGVALFAKPLLVLVAAPAFHQAEDIIPIVCLAYLFFSLHEHFKVPALLAKRTLSLLPAFIAAATVTIIVNLLLIPRLGLAGAAWTSVLSFATFSFLGLWRYRLIDKYPYPFDRCAVVLAGMIVTYLAFRLLDRAGLLGFWLFALAALAWCGWAALLFGRETGRLATLIRPPVQPQPAELTCSES